MEGGARNGTGSYRVTRRYAGVMATSADLYAAILADPDDLDLRWRYADAIEATDPERAELIRLYLARSYGTRESVYLHRRIRPRLAEPVTHLLNTWQLRNGLIESVTMTARTFVDHGEEVWAHHPVRHLVLVEAAGLMTEVAQVACLNRLVALDLSGNPIGDDGLATLVDSPHLGRLRWLGLAGCGIGAAGAEALAATRNLPALRYVDLSDNLVQVTAQGYGQHIDGSPVWVEMPALGQELIARYGHLPWLDEQWGWRLLGVVRWDEV
ncbi:hypothetical protein ACIBQ2_23070 [Micromonospora sediminimaris]|uniref:hypothetical protein n=1 Tax=Micromonospora sediminimaris TaxID=547162 RepID=UPI000B8A3596